MDRDFVLQWRPTQSAAPRAALFTEEINDAYYSLLMVIPPDVNISGTNLPRDIIFIIDTSGSMGGEPIKQAKQSLLSALDKLEAHDRFNIIEFNSSHSSLYASPRHADNTNLNYAKQWVENLRSGGGTHMRPAVTSAFKQLQENSPLQQVVFITDGAIDNEYELFKVIYNNLGDARLFTVGIGAAPNTHFMKKAAKFGRGTFTFVGNINTVSEKIDALFDKLDHAFSTNISVEWPGKNDSFPRKTPDLYLNEPLILTSKLSSLTGTVEISGESQQHPWQLYVNLDQGQMGEGVGTIWAREKIESLEDKKVRGGNAKGVKQMIIQTALRHKLLSRYTSFVAVEEKIVRPQAQQSDSSAVLNPIPKGHILNQTLRAVPYSNTATNAALTWWLGLFILLAYIVYTRLKND